MSDIFNELDKLDKAMPDIFGSQIYLLDIYRSYLWSTIGVDSFVV